MPLAQARGPAARLCSNPNPLPDGRRIHTGGAIDRTEWMERTGCMAGKYFHNDRTGWLSFKTSGQFVYCAPTGYVFGCHGDKQLWATNCLHNHSTPTQCRLGTLISPFSIHSSNESKHWVSSLKPFTGLTRNLPGNIPDGDAYFAGYALLPRLGDSCPPIRPSKLASHSYHHSQ